MLFRSGLNPHNVPGGVGYDLPSLQGYDPKVNRQRDGMVIHMGRSNDPQKLYSHGCLALPPEEFPVFQQKMNDFKKKFGSAYINVFPDGHISVTSKPAFNGKDGVLTADGAAQQQKEAILNNQTPPFNNPVSQQLTTEFQKTGQDENSFNDIVKQREATGLKGQELTTSSSIDPAAVNVQVTPTGVPEHMRVAGEAPPTQPVPSTEQAPAAPAEPTAVPVKEQKKKAEPPKDQPGVYREIGRAHV